MAEKRTLCFEKLRNLPHLRCPVRPDSFDPILSNMGTDEMRQIIGSDLISSLSDLGQCDLKGVFW